MNVNQYITDEDVQAICAELGISDWTKLDTTEINPTEAETIREYLGGEALELSLEGFKLGLEIELEHGRRFSDANVSNNHPIITGKIVLAHLKEGLDYYLRLACVELEMEQLSALIDKDSNKAIRLRAELSDARVRLEEYVKGCLRQN